MCNLTDVVFCSQVHVAALESSGGNTQKNKERSPFESGEQKGLIRQLDSGLDLASAGGGGSHPPGDGSGTESNGYALVGELGVHVAAVTSIVTDATCSLLCVGDASGVVSLTDLTNGLMLTNTRVFTGDGEGVGSMTLCPPILGTGPKIDKNLDHSEGSGTIDGDTEEGEDGKGVGEEAETSREADKSFPPSRFPGAEVLCVASTKSAVVFLDTALGKCHKTTSPKTPSIALAVAPLTVSGTVAASVMTGKFILILVRAIRVTTCFVYRRRRRRAPRVGSPLASVVQRCSRGRFGRCAYGR